MGGPNAFSSPTSGYSSPSFATNWSRSPLTNATSARPSRRHFHRSGIQENVLPSTARAVINLRILPGESTAAVIEQVRTAYRDQRHHLTPLATRVEPSP